MEDSTIEILGLITIIIGLLVAQIYVLDNKPRDAFFQQSNDNNVIITGNIASIKSSPKGNYFEITACRNIHLYPSTNNLIKGFKENESISAQGTFYNKGFYANQITVI